MPIDPIGSGAVPCCVGNGCQSIWSDRVPSHAAWVTGANRSVRIGSRTMLPIDLIVAVVVLVVIVALVLIVVVVVIVVTIVV